MILEACTGDINSSIEAEKQGAHQIELCSHLELDGLEPERNIFKHLIESLSIGIKVMIRPRLGNFLYSESEVQAMLNSIHFYKKHPIQGFVFGCLTAQHRIDLQTTQRLCQAAAPFPCTFHKAIDEADNIFEAVDDLNSIEGIKFILTSGTHKTALEGAEIINQMIERSNKIIIAAGKITSSNLKEVSEKINTSHFHGKKIVNQKI